MEHPAASNCGNCGDCGSRTSGLPYPRPSTPREITSSTHPVCRPVAAEISSAE